MQIRNLCACVCAWGEETHQKRWIQLLLCSTRSDVHVDVHAHKSAENNRNGSRASHLPRSESARQGTALLVLRSLIWCFWLRPPFGGCRSDEQRRRKRFRWTTVAGGRDLGGGLYPPVAVSPKRAWTNLGLILAEHEQRKLLPPKFGTGITPFLRVGWPFPTDSFSPQPTWSRLDGSAGNTGWGKSSPRWRSSSTTYGLHLTASQRPRTCGQVPGRWPNIVLSSRTSQWFRDSWIHVHRREPFT